MSNEENNRLDHLVQVLNSGREFYQHARERITDRELQGYFNANLADRDELEKVLQQELTKRAGNPQRRDDLEARLEEYRAELEAVIRFNEPHIYMDHLEHLEEKTSEAFREALDAARSPDLRQLLLAREHLFRRMHERIQAARQATAERRIAYVGMNQIREVRHDNSGRK